MKKYSIIGVFRADLNTTCESTGHRSDCRTWKQSTIQACASVLQKVSPLRIANTFRDISTKWDYVLHATTRVIVY